MPLHDFNKYIGIPYKNQGRGWDGVDCWGLYYLIFKTELNIELPDFSNLAYCSEWYKKGQNIFEDQLNKRDMSMWDVIEPPYQTDCRLDNSYTLYYYRVLSLSMTH